MPSGAGRRLLAASLPRRGGRLRLGRSRGRARTRSRSPWSQRSRCPPACPRSCPPGSSSPRSHSPASRLSLRALPRRRVRDVVDRGLRDIYAVAPPFAASRHGELHALVMLTVAAFCLAIAITACSPALRGGRRHGGRRRLAGDDLGRRGTRVAMGALALLAALWPVLLGGVRDRRALASRRGGAGRCGPRGHGRGRGRREAVGRGARLAELGPVRRVPRRADGGARLELRLQRHRLPARRDDRAPHHRAPGARCTGGPRLSTRSQATAGSSRSTRLLRPAARRSAARRPAAPGCGRVARRAG